MTYALWEQALERSMELQPHSQNYPGLYEHILLKQREEDETRSPAVALDPSMLSSDGDPKFS